MFVIKNILVTTDFSAFSTAAIEYASSFALLYGATIHLVHVIESAPVVGIPDIGLATDFREDELEVRAREEMRKFVYWKLKNNSNMEHVILHGEPHREITRYALEQEIDMIVIATHGRTGLAHILMGSVAEKILRLSPVPVLVVKPWNSANAFLERKISRKNFMLSGGSSMNAASSAGQSTQRCHSTGNQKVIVMYSPDVDLCMSLTLYFQNKYMIVSTTDGNTLPELVNMYNPFLVIVDALPTSWFLRLFDAWKETYPGMRVMLFRVWRYDDRKREAAIHKSIDFVVYKPIDIDFVAHIVDGFFEVPGEQAQSSRL